MDRTGELLERYQRDRPNAAPIDPEKLTEFLKRKEYTAKPHRNWSLATMLKVGMGQAVLFEQMNWLFVRAPERTSFVLSDTPLSIIEPPRRVDRPG